MTHPISDDRPQPPPDYAVSLPQVLVAPLPDSASFFHGRTVQGEVFVKGLGDGPDRRGANRLSVRLHLQDRLPDHPDISLEIFPEQTIWTKASSSHTATSTDISRSTDVFPTSHRFTINLSDAHSPGSSTGRTLPGTLNLTEWGKGEIKWWLRVTLGLASGEVYEDVNIEGTPSDTESEKAGDRVANEEEASLDKQGVITRLVVEDTSPRLGSLLRLGVELRPKDRQRTGVAALASQPDPGATLRALRRVRVELYRLVTVISPSSGASTSTAIPTDSREHLTLLHASGKSLRYPGSNHPPLRVLFTLPTAQLGSTVDHTWGEISMSTTYHVVTFFVRVILGFGALAEAAPEEMRDFVIEQKISVRPRVWRVRQRTIRESMPDADIPAELSQEEMTDEEYAREAYRLKGRDVVGQAGTYRSTEEDEPPAFDEPGPSNRGAGPSGSAPETGPGGLPSFLESEAQAAGHAVSSETREDRDIGMEGVEEMSEEDDRATMVGRRGSLKGELGTWIEYDGYETFSVAPPSASVSFGASGSMDPPQPDDEDVNVAGGMAARLGLRGSGGVGGMELMEQLGLGEGTRVIDLHDDLPPGIDEPSLPALPTFTQSSYSSNRHRVMPHPAHPHPPPPHPISNDISPPSFAASEAAHADTRTGQPGLRRQSNALPAINQDSGLSTPPPPIEAPSASREDPPGYFGQPGGGPPAYS